MGTIVENVLELVTEMSQNELMECRRIGQELAKQAAEQHSGMVEDAHSRIKTIYESVRRELEGVSSASWAVTVRNEELNAGKWTSVVALSEMVGDTALQHQWEVAVETEYVIENAASSVSCGYRTRMRAIVEDMEDLGLPEGAVITEIAAPQFVGAVVV